MSIYLRHDEIKPGKLIRVMSRETNEIAPALIVSFEDMTPQRGDFVRVMDTDGETYLMNTLYLERWK